MNTIRRIKNKSDLLPSDIGRLYLCGNLKPFMEFKQKAQEILNEPIDQEWFDGEVKKLDKTGYHVYARYIMLVNWLLVLSFRGREVYNRVLAIAKGIELEMHSSIAIAETARTIAEHQQGNEPENANISASCLDKIDSYWFTKFNNEPGLKKLLGYDFEELQRNYKELLELKAVFHTLAMKLEVPELEYAYIIDDVKIAANCFQILEQVKTDLKEAVEKLTFIPTDERTKLANDVFEIFPDFTVYKNIRVPRSNATKARNIVDVDLTKFDISISNNFILSVIQGK